MLLQVLDMIQRSCEDIFHFAERDLVDSTILSPDFIHNGLDGNRSEPFRGGSDGPLHGGAEAPDEREFERHSRIVLDLVALVFVLCD